MSIVAPPADDYVFLVGRPPVSEFLGFLKTMAVDGQLLDQAVLVAEWRDANDRVLALEKAEAGWADKPSLDPLPPAMAERANGALGEPSVKKVFGLLPSAWAMVELDRLVVYGVDPISWTVLSL